MENIKQLYIDKDSPKEIYPKQYMDNVFDSPTGENLYAYLSKFNCINVGYVADKKSARKSIPQMFRLVGTLCIYHTDSKNITIEQYVGSKESAGEESEWVLDSNWRSIVGTDSILDGTITLEKLSKELQQLIGSNPNVNIDNYPDGEDLTQFDICGENSKNSIFVLKFADKSYKPTIFSGKGRKYLRKNLQNFGEDGAEDYKNILTQEMFDAENTIYIIQYDYDLNGETITLPDKACLYFVGGTVNNGNITCSNTDIQGVYTFDQCGTAVFSGTYKQGMVMFIEGALKYWDGAEWVDHLMKGEFDTVEKLIEGLKTDIETVKGKQDAVRPTIDKIPQIETDVKSLIGKLDVIKETLAELGTKIDALPKAQVVTDNQSAIVDKLGELAKAAEAVQQGTTATTDKLTQFATAVETVKEGVHETTSQVTQLATKVEEYKGEVYKVNAAVQSVGLTATQCLTEVKNANSTLTVVQGQIAQAQP